MSQKMSKCPFIGGALLCTSLFFAPHGQAAIIADFNGGNGTSEVDGYTGAIGGGWATPWIENAQSTPSASAITMTALVTGASPLTPAGGDYLNVATTASSAGTRYAMVHRKLGTDGGIDLSQPYKVSFDFRPQTPFNTGSTQVDDRYVISGNNATPNTNLLGSANTWLASVSAGSAGSGVPAGTAAGVWGFLTNPSDPKVSVTSSSNMNFVNSGISMAVGTTYQFEILVDPVNKSYVASIDDGVTSFTSDTLYWRDQGNPDLADTSAWISFGRRQTNSGTQVGGYSFSIDSLRVVPEPTAVVLVCIGMPFVARLRRKK